MGWRDPHGRREAELRLQCGSAMRSSHDGQAAIRARLALALERLDALAGSRASREMEVRQRRAGTDRVHAHLCSQGSLARNNAELLGCGSNPRALQIDRPLKFCRTSEIRQLPGVVEARRNRRIGAGLRDIRRDATAQSSGISGGPKKPTSPSSARSG